MSTVAEIKAAIPKLTLEERAEVARCLGNWQDDEWDEQMKRDIAAGIDDLDNGRFQTCSEANVMQLAEDIGQSGRARFKKSGP